MLIDTCCGLCYTGFLFFFKQKTAYDLRISDWSSDVCSSDLTTVQIDRAGDAFRERLSFRIEVAPPDKRSIRRRYFHGHANPILDRLAACAYAFRQCCGLHWKSQTGFKRRPLFNADTMPMDTKRRKGKAGVWVSPTRRLAQ